MRPKPLSPPLPDTYDYKVIKAIGVLMTQSYFFAYENNRDPRIERKERQDLLRALSDRMLGYSQDYEVLT